MGIGFEEAISQQRMTNRLLVALLLGSKSQGDIGEMLMATGASPAEVASVIGTTPATISAEKSRRNKARQPEAMAVELPEAHDPR